MAEPLPYSTLTVEDRDAVGDRFPRRVRELFEQVQANFDHLATRFPEPVGQEGLRFVRGTVDSAGVASGAGFTSARTGAGAYTVTFSPGFGSVPVLVAMASGASQVFHEVSASATAVAVHTTADCAFVFIAAGVGFA